MKQLVHEQPPALPLIILGDHLPAVRGPRDAAPRHRRVHEADHAGTVTSRRRLVRGDRSSGGVRDYHRPAQRHTPVTPAVPLAERLGLLEVLLGARLIDLRGRGDHGDEDEQQAPARAITCRARSDRGIHTGGPGSQASTRSTA